jgi:hypothetical protein
MSWSFLWAATPVADAPLFLGERFDCLLKRFVVPVRNRADGQRQDAGRRAYRFEEPRYGIGVRLVQNGAGSSSRRLAPCLTKKVMYKSATSLPLLEMPGT